MEIRKREQDILIIFIKFEKINYSFLSKLTKFLSNLRIEPF